MTIHYALDEKDFLTFQLFAASPSIVKRRRFTRFSFAAIYIILGGVLLAVGKLPIGVILLLLGVLWFIVYPMYERKRYRNHYITHIKEHYEGRLNRPSSITFSKEGVETNNSGGESKLPYTELDAMQEIGGYIYIRLKTGVSFIIPKQKTDNPAETIAFLKNLASRLNIPYATNLDWTWK